MPGLNAIYRLSIVHEGSLDAAVDSVCLSAQFFVDAPLNGNHFKLQPVFTLSMPDLFNTETIIVDRLDGKYLASLAFATRVNLQPLEQSDSDMIFKSDNNFVADFIQDRCLDMYPVISTSTAQPIFIPIQDKSTLKNKWVKLCLISAFPGQDLVRLGVDTELVIDPTPLRPSTVALPKIDTLHKENMDLSKAEQESLSHLIELSQQDLIQESWFAEKVSSIEEMVAFNRSAQSSHQSSILITAPHKYGKTSLLNVLASNWSGKDHLERLSGTDLKMPKSNEFSVEKLCLTLYAAISHEPSVILIDDLDLSMVCNGSLRTSVWNKFRSLVESIMGGQNVVIIATVCQNNEEIQDWFSDNVQMNESTAEARFSLLQHLFRRKVCAHMSHEVYASTTLANQIVSWFSGLQQKQWFASIWRTVAEYTDKFNLLDLSILAESFFVNWIKNGDSEFTCKDAIKIVNNHRSAHNLNDSSKNNVSTDMPWDEIKGMSDAKKILLESITWPVRYSKLFGQCPIAPRKGILLVGPPGCGKTLLANATGAFANLPVIKVKGPELLNKYIGQSEEAVRQVFERASAVKPSILLFDELDSLAPVRGHDQTGVTDRVVNQMLTMMDGAESLSGVVCLGTTSRPDLIDPALLRPGRFDTYIQCTLPGYSERVDILSTLGERMGSFASRPPWEDVAGWCEGWTGADLYALVSNSHLESTKHELEKELLKTQKTLDTTLKNREQLISENIKRSSTASTVENASNGHFPDMTLATIRTEFEAMKPSLSAPELARYDRNFAHFRGEQREIEKQRATFL